MVKNKKKKKTKIIVTICILLIIIVFLIPILLSVFIYESNFGNRYESASWLIRNLEDYDGLKRERYTFTSNDGQELVGYKYHKDINSPKGVVIIAHGLGGGGHNSYMEIADYFASNGYVSFAYDATGNDESEGDSVKGLPQGLIDLDYAVSFVKSNPDFEGLPIMLFGHSWGAFSSGNVLNLHPDIKAVVMVAGFNKSVDIIEEEGSRMMGSAIKLLLPYVSVIEKIKFGKYSSYTSIKGFDASDAGIMLIHSEDDEMISFENQFMNFYNTYKDNPRFNFVRYENRGHNYVYYSDASEEYRKNFNKQFSEYINSTNSEINAELKEVYMKENCDISSLRELDSELMNNILSFYNDYAA